MKEIKIGTYTKTGNFSVNRITHPTKDQKYSIPNRNRVESKPEKTSKPRKKLSFKKLVIWVIVTFVLVFVGFMVYRWYSLQTRVKGNNGTSVQTKCTDILNPDCWTEALRPQLKQDDGFTNMLIVGLDTRDSGKGSSLKNTDSIMVASLNHETNQVMLISIPRDFYVTFKITDKDTGKQAGPYSMKITSVYATGEARDDVDDGMELLEEVVEGIIGEPIQYRTVVKLQAVEDLVDTFGGIELTLPFSFAAQYPNDNPNSSNPNHWLRYEFKEGVNYLDGEKALVYARFRHVYGSQHLELASDFSRGERQQEVINALKDKALAENLSTKDKAEKYWGILQTLQKNVETQLTFEDILAGLSLIDKVDREPLNVVLDPNFGGADKIIYHPPTNDSTGYIIQARDKSYKGIQDELKRAWEYGHLYEEKAHLLVANKSGKTYVAGDKAFTLKNSDAPLGTITYLTQTKTDKTGINIYDFSNGKYPETIKFLKEYFGVEEVITDTATAGITKSTYKEDILIVVGPQPTTTPSPTTAP